MNGNNSCTNTIQNKEISVLFFFPDGFHYLRVSTHFSVDFV